VPAPGAANGVWQAPDLSRWGDGLLVNVAEAVGSGQARIASPSGAAIGRDKYVDVRQLTVVDADRGRGLAGASRRQWLYMHPPSSVSVDVALPAGREVWFNAALALDPEAWSAAAGNGVVFQAFVTRLSGTEAAGQPTAVLDRTIDPRSSVEHRRWVPAEVDLTAWAGSTIRLTLRTDPRGDLANDWAGWANPVVVVRDFARVRPAAP
jgi:hypothetical protein